MTGDLHADRGRAESFGAQADRYDATRPGYPPEAIAAVLRADAENLRVLDVGCGTGIASRLLAAAGARVLGVETDPAMAEVARQRGSTVEVSRFEQWDPSGRRFDRVVSAQAWHWVDPVAGATKAADVLVEAGRLCLVGNEGGVGCAASHPQRPRTDAGRPAQPAARCRGSDHRAPRGPLRHVLQDVGRLRGPSLSDQRLRRRRKSSSTGASITQVLRSSATEGPGR